MKSRKLTGAAVAIAAAGLFATAPLVASADSGDAMVKCFGANQCKGKNDCKTATNSCKGKSSCKGLSFVNMSSAKDCEEVGGKLKPKKM